MLTGDQLLAALWRWRYTVVLTFLLTLVAIAAVTYSLPKVYESSAYILVGSRGPAGSDFEATQTNQVVLKTYAELLQARSVTTEVSEALPFEMSPDEIESAVSVVPISQSQLVRISAESGDRERARVLAGTYADVFVDRAGELSEDTGGSISATIAERPVASELPIRPQPRLYLLAGAVLSGLLAAAVALLRDRLGQRLVIERESTELLGLPILARIPQQPSGVMRTLTSFDGEAAQHRTVVEAFEFLWTNLAFSRSGATPARSLAVVSASEGEGKTACCVGLAVVAARHGVDVLLVDADLRRRHLTAVLGRRLDGSGLSDVLKQDPSGWPDQIVGTDLGSGVRAVGAGSHVSNPGPLLDGSIRAFERWASEMSSFVVIDTPPVSVAADASLVAAAVEDVLVVVDARDANRSALRRTIEQLRRVHANVVGVVVNRVEASEGPAAYYGEHERRRRTWHRSRTDAVG